MDPTGVVSEAGKQLLAQGLLGVLIIGLIVVVIYLWKEIAKERDRCQDSQNQILKLGGDLARSNSEVARSLEERNRLTAEISASNSKLGTAIEHLSQILELQHDRVLELLREIKFNQNQKSPTP